MAGCFQDSAPRGPQKFSYTYKVLAELFGVKPQTVREYASRNYFDPEDLKSIVEFWMRRKDGVTFTKPQSEEPANIE